MMREIVIDAMTGQRLPGIPTPTLVEAGRGLAYFVPNTGHGRERIPGVWYLKATGYESPTGEYRLVYLVQKGD